MKMNAGTKMALLCVLVVVFAVKGSAALELTGHAEVEGKYFLNEPMYDEQVKDSGSLSVRTELYHEWKNSLSFTLVPFYRYDNADEERTHFDIREAIFLWPRESYELSAGIGKVFWGVTEAIHLVDIINQTDWVESLDGEEKLGQPMVNLTLLTGYGTWDFFVLPYFRERTFQGSKGRLRFDPPIDTGAVYESGEKERRVDYAVRYSNTAGNWDIGVSHFNGTTREPAYLLQFDKDSNPVIVPYYEIINQTGIDLQCVTGAWLWKFEGIYRSGQDDGDFFAMDAGLEYTFSIAYLRGADIGLIAEYLYDSRKSELNTFYNDDYMIGLRIALNDVAGSEALFGLVQDFDNGSGIFLMEASRRLGDNWKGELESYIFVNAEKDALLNFLRKDDFFRLAITYYF